MGFPKIKDRLFFFFTVKEQGVFMAQTTQNELIAKPSSLSSHIKLNSVVRRSHVSACVCVFVESTRIA